MRSNIKLILIFTIQIFFTQQINSQSNHDSLQFLIVFDTTATQIEIDEIMMDHNAFEIWQSPYSGVRLWETYAFPFQMGNDYINNIKESIKRAKERAKVTSSGPNYVVSTIDDVISVTLQMGDNSCENDFNHLATSSFSDLKVCIMDTGLTDFGSYPNHTFEYGTFDGYDYINLDAVPEDEHGHGTHIAGIVSHACQHMSGGQLDNITFDIRKVFDSFGNGDLSTIIYALDEAVMNGANVVNMSFAYEAEKPTLKPEPMEFAIEKAAELGVLMVCAAGNNSLDNDNALLPSYPASFDSDNILSVGSVNCSRNLSTFSNYGFETVDVTSLGEGIRGPSPEGFLVSKSGTSQSTAITSGIAVAVGSYMSSPHWDPIKCQIVTTVDAEQSLTGVINSGGIVDASEATPYGFNQFCLSSGGNQDSRVTANSDVIADNHMFNNGVISLTNSSETVDIYVYDLLGRVLMNKKIDEQYFDLRNTNELRPGLDYIVVVRTSKGSFAEKIRL